ncbi:Hypothetical predicted protein [Cloeon dipterum]|uniref:PIH1 domain-containing protein 1 n=1 Tax=Cloeon dipterum TaxID=197152 RepID=A0A8S1CIT5_9INSE|nr:Hypothetical predicted protein [Cloeon dipterum]
MYLQFGVAGICVKARATSGEKVFLNLCTSEFIPQTKDVSEIDLAKILNSEDPSSFRVPMSLGEGRFEKDKSGKQCQVFDIAIHPKTLQKLEDCELFRQFLLTASMEGIQNKYNAKLQIGDVTILSKRKSLGTPKSQRIRANDLKPRPKVPKYKIRGEPAKGKLLKMVAELNLPDVSSAEELTLDVGEDRILMQAHKTNYKLDVYLPHLIDQDKVSAQFNKDSKILLLNMPVKRVSTVQEIATREFAEYELKRSLVSHIEIPVKVSSPTTGIFKRSSSRVAGDQNNRHPTISVSRNRTATD